MSKSTQTLEPVDPSARKESLLTSLLSESSGVSSAQRSAAKSGKPLIAVINDEETAQEDTKKDIPPAPAMKVNPAISNHVPSAPVEDEGPSMLELMMAAQKEAAAEKRSAQEEEQKKAAKTGFGGLKKGFLGGSSNKSSKATSTKSAPAPQKVSKEEEPIIEIRRQPSNANKQQSAAAAGSKIVAEVQKAIDEDTHPLVKQLQSQEWVTDDLMSQMQNNAVLRRGLQHPKCLAALELLQRNPQEAQQKFRNDPEVGQFMQEFCQLMSVHFTNLGAKQQQQQQEQASSSSSGTAPQPKIAEIGPLQAQALAKQQQRTSATASSSSSSSSASNSKSTIASAAVLSSKSAAKTSSSPPASAETEEERVQRVSVLHRHPALVIKIHCLQHSLLIYACMFTSRSWRILSCESC